jgi:hypothetical protein
LRELNRDREGAISGKEKKKNYPAPSLPRTLCQSVAFRHL